MIRFKNAMQLNLYSLVRLSSIFRKTFNKEDLTLANSKWFIEPDQDIAGLKNAFANPYPCQMDWLVFSCLVCFLHIWNTKKLVGAVFTFVLMISLLFNGHNLFRLTHIILFASPPHPYSDC